MNIIRVIADILIIYGIVGFVYIKKPDRVPLCGILIMLIQTIEIYFLYRGQENSSFFFLHAYISLLAVSLLIFFIQKRLSDKFEHLFLLPVCVIPIMSGFELCTAWMMKLYIR